MSNNKAVGGGLVTTAESFLYVTSSEFKNNSADVSTAGFQMKKTTA